MKPDQKVRLGGLVLDPISDMALPMLLNLAAALTVALVAGALKAWFGLRVVPAVSLLAFLFAWESYLFTTVFSVREVDVPDALRWVEVVLMAGLAKVIAALPMGVGLVGAVTGAWSSGPMWLGFGLLAFGWMQGMNTARQLQYLHVGLLEVEAGQERLANDLHARAFYKLRDSLFGQILAAAALLGVFAWANGDVQLWGINWLGLGLLALTATALVAVLLAAQVKQRITWIQERQQPSDQVFARWAPAGLSLVILPILLAVILPAGPRLPVEKLLALLPEGTKQEIKLPAPPQGEAPQMDMPPELIEQLNRDPWITWRMPTWVWYVLGAIPVLLILRSGARQLADYARAQRLTGIWAVLATVAAWYLALWRAVGDSLGRVLKQAVVTPAEAFGTLLRESGLARYLPVRAGRAPGEPRAALRFYFARLQAEAARRGVRRGASGTAGEFAHRLATAAPEQAGEVAQLKEAYEQARYSDLPVGGEQVGFARRAWVAIARAIGKGGPR